MQNLFNDLIVSFLRGACIEALSSDRLGNDGEVKQQPVDVTFAAVRRGLMGLLSEPGIFNPITMMPSADLMTRGQSILDEVLKSHGWTEAEFTAALQKK